MIDLASNLIPESSRIAPRDKRWPRRSCWEPRSPVRRHPEIGNQRQMIRRDHRLATPQDLRAHHLQRRLVVAVIEAQDRQYAGISSRGSPISYWAIALKTLLQ